MNKIFFIADTHFGHKNVLKHCPNRPFASQNDTLAHDQWLMELWNSTVNKNDFIYILGDLSFHTPNRTIMLHGHCHGKIDTFNNESGELTNGLRFSEYVTNNYKKNLL